MKILVTGAGGFVGKNLCESLRNLRDGKDRTRPSLKIEEIFATAMNFSEKEAYSAELCAKIASGDL